MNTDIQRGLPANVRLPHERDSFGITAFFRHHAPLNVALSEEAGREVHDPIIEVVELQLAGDRNYSPVVPAASMAFKDGNRVVTYAELYGDQYRAFILGDDQIAGGTALETLTQYGMTPAQLSLCRALKIYSVEALHQLDGPALKGLGMSANEMKAAARRFMESRTGGEMDALRAELAALKAKVEPQQDETQIKQAVAAVEADDAKAALKDQIEQITGARPRGNPSVETLEKMLSEAQGA